MTRVKIGTINDSSGFDACLAESAGSGKVPAIIIIQEIRSVNANIQSIRAICDDSIAIRLRSGAMYSISYGLGESPMGILPGGIRL